MDKGLLIGLVSYLLIFIFATGMPVYIFIKARLLKELCALFSLILSVVLINLHFFVLSRLQLVSAPFLSEFHEVFWLIPPIVVYFCCFFIQRKKKEQSD
jgi:hypothetical protein